MAINFRGIVLPTLFRLRGSYLYKYYKEFKLREWGKYEKLKEIQRNNLFSLLSHAVNHCELYHGISVDSKSIESTLNNFPIIGKSQLVDQRERIIAKNYNSKGKYENSSGGSTGRPVRFVQDKYMWDRNMGMKLFYLHMCGKELGERELKLWGSERDIFKGSVGFKTKIENVLYNRKLLNSFKMSEDKIVDYIKEIDRWKPKILWTYVDSIHEISRFILYKNLSVRCPDVIMTTAGTLFDSVRKEIQEAFPDSYIVNQYGSREVGDIACECLEHDGLHILGQNQYIEVVNEEGQSCRSGEIGELVVTLLTNYSMPLIRYRIGDTGAFKRGFCRCGRETDMLEQVSGRITDHFINSKRELIHGEYFTHLFYHMDWIKAFQVIQNDLDIITVKYVTRGEQIYEEDLKNIKAKIKHVMNDDCSIHFERHHNIPPSASGKYLYTKSLVRR